MTALLDNEGMWTPAGEGLDGEIKLLYENYIKQGCDPDQIEKVIKNTLVQSRPHKRVVVIGTASCAGFVYTFDANAEDYDNIQALCWRYNRHGNRYDRNNDGTALCWPSVEKFGVEHFKKHEQGSIEDAFNWYRKDGEVKSVSYEKVVEILQDGKAEHWPH